MYIRKMNFANYKMVKSYSIFYIQIGENRVKVMNFVYVMIIFFSLFLATMNVDGGKPFFINFVVTSYKMF
jgi:hypothetical protein